MEENRNVARSAAQTVLSSSSAETKHREELHIDRVESLDDHLKLFIIFSLLFITVGIFLYPLWWQIFLFQRGFLERGVWYGGISYLLQRSLIPFVVVCTVLYLESIFFKRKVLNTLLKRCLENATRYLYRKDKYVVLALSIALLICLITLHSRSESQQTLLNEKISLTQSEVQSPLEKPSRFIFLSENVINSLYKQREDDLAIAKVTEEIQESKGITGEVQLSEILKTDAEQNEVRRKVTEYQAAQKTPEQQLKSLVGYLYSSDLIPTYGLTPNINRRSVYIQYSRDIYDRAINESGRYGRARQSEDMLESERLEEAIRTIERYGLSVEPEQLEILRNRLLSREIQDIETELRDLQGQVLVVGNGVVAPILKQHCYPSCPP